MLAILPHVLAPIVVSTIVMIFVLQTDRLQQGGRTTNEYLPPGWTVGLIWVFILGVLGFAHYLAFARRDYTACVVLIGIILKCISYPFYAINATLAKVGNVTTLLAGCLVAVYFALTLPVVLPYMFPLMTWLSYVVVTDYALT